VIEMEGHRHGRVLGHRAEHLVEHLRPDGLDRLEGRLDDEGRVELGGGVDHGPQAHVVHDVERGDAVPLFEGGIEDVSEGGDRHLVAPGEPIRNRTVIASAATSAGAPW